MATVTFSAILPNGEIATRTTGTREYVACLAVADKGGDNWGARSWHLTHGAAIAAMNSAYIRDTYSAQVVEVDITKVVGKTVPGTDLHDIKAALAADAKAAKAAAVTVTGDVAGLLTEGTALVAEALAEVRAKADAPADLTVADIVEAEVHSMTVAEVMADLFPVADSPADAVADADGVVHTATLPDGQVVTRTAPAGKYAAVLAVVAADGTWAARSWHLTAASAKRRSRHHRGSVPVPVSDGVTPGTAWADAPTDAPADSDIDATADALGAMLSAV